jgi:hypothetical protein
MSTPQDTVRRWLAEARATAPPDTYAARRTEPRYEWHCLLELQVNGKVQYVQTRDISRHGIGINTRLTLEDGQKVMVRREEPDPWIPAKIKRATQTVGGYKVGVGFDLDLDLELVCSDAQEEE